MTSKNKRAFSIFIILFLISLLGNAFLLIQNIQVNTNFRKIQSELSIKNEDIQNYVYQRAKPLTQTFEVYDFKTFGVYSPLLEKKSASVNTYDYLTNTIAARTIQQEYKNQQIAITVWTITDGRDNLPLLQDHPVFPGLGNKIPVVDEYENHGTPRFVPPDKYDEVYITKRGKKMLLRYEYAPKSIGSVMLEHYSAFSVSQNPIYIIVSVNVKDYPISNQQNVQEAVKIAQEVADTLDTKIY